MVTKAQAERAAAAQAPDWEVVPGAGDDVQAIAQRCRKQVQRRALFAAGVAMVPVPGLDWLTDVGVLVRLLPQISAQFGLTPAQIERLVLQVSGGRRLPAGHCRPGSRPLARRHSDAMPGPD